MRVVRVASELGIPGTTEVDFEATTADAKKGLLDQIEARLILLRAGGPATRSFTKELMEQLGAAGTPLPHDVVVSVAEPHQLEHRGGGRRLASAAARQGQAQLGQTETFV